VTTNQITWQVGSLQEVVNGFDYFKKHGLRIHRAGRDSPGSNWHTYPFDPDGHVNEVYYGIEQIGWDGLSKPMAMHEFRYTETPSLPHRSEYAEVAAGHARGVDPNAGWRQVEPLKETHDVGGVLLARPFKVVRVGPVRLFVKDIDQALAFYRDMLGLSITEQITWNGHRCVFLRANTEHHSLALYPIALRAELGLNPNTTLFSFGIQVADYAQLKGALGFLGENGVAIKKLPPELFPGIDYSAFAVDPDPTSGARRRRNATEKIGGAWLRGEGSAERRQLQVSWLQLGSDIPTIHHTWGLGGAAGRPGGHVWRAEGD
jgi:catechol 2,3-dioxygenase-like lactoylglutathione lyase family enzyme